MDNLHILVVDDNHINRLFFESALRKLSCQVTSAVNGLEAIEKATKIQFDLILMDIRMDGMNGIESAFHIKQLDNQKKTPIIAVSAETFAIDQYVDFSASLLKPVNQENLAHIIAQFTQKNLVFNHEQALEISHQDEHIVFHLRDLFLEQLDDFETSIIKLYQDKDFQVLQEKLHQLLGSAKICAAENIANKVTILKEALGDNHATNQGEAVKQLMAAIKQAQSIN